METIKIEVRDLAFFVKANLKELINANWNTPAGDIAYKINNLIKEVSDNRYGYFFGEGYYLPPIAIVVKALQKMFNANKILLINPNIFGVYANDLKNIASTPRWRTREKALEQVIRYRYEK